MNGDPVDPKHPESEIPRPLSFDAELAPPPDDEEKTQPGQRRLIDMKEVLEFIANREMALDVRVETMEDALAKKVAAVIVGQLGPVQAGMRVLGESQQRQERMFKEWSETAIALVTRVSQLEQKLEQQMAICQLRHGNGLSMPPDGEGADSPPGV
jgi:hypothetical protein